MSSYRYLDEEGFETFWSGCKKFIKKHLPNHLSDLDDDLDLLTIDTYHKDIGTRINYRGEIDTYDDLPERDETDIGDLFRIKEGCDYKNIPPHGFAIRSRYEWQAFFNNDSEPITRIPESTIDDIMSNHK